MITTLTGKHQVTVPAEIVLKAGLKPGARLEWRCTDRADLIEIRVQPDPVTIAAGLRGRGNRFRRHEGSAVGRLHKERESEERDRNRA